MNPIKGRAKIRAHLPEWSVSYEGARRCYRAAAPNYEVSGLVIEGQTPEEVIERAGAIRFAGGAEAAPTERRAAPASSEVPSNGGGAPLHELPDLPEEPDDTSNQIRRTAGTPRDQALAEARIKGYAGEACTNCGAMTMVRNGACLKCVSCGSSSGCS